MKKILSLTIFVLAAIFFPNLTSAETVVNTPSDTESTTYEVVSVRNISVVNLSFDNFTPYNPGDVVKGSFTFVNNDPVDYPDVYIIEYIVHKDKDNKTTGIYGTSEKQGPFFVNRNSEKVINFEYKLPNSGKEGGRNLLAVELMSGTGIPIGYLNDDITLNIQTPVLTLDKLYVEIDGKKYGLQDGPTVASTTSPDLVVEFKGLSGNDTILVPNLKVYDSQPIRSVVYDSDSSSNLTKIPPINVKASQTISARITMPILSKPGVYAGEVRFTDSDGIERASNVSLRWIVDGPMVTFPSVSVDKTSVSKGEAFTLNVKYTGAPLNIDTFGQFQTGDGEITATVSDENGEKVVSASKDVNFNTMDGSADFPLIAEKDASKLSLLVVAIQDGKELARYETGLSDPEKKDIQNSNLFSDSFIKYGVAVLILMVIILVLLTLRKRGVGSMKMFVFALILINCALFLAPKSVKAETQYINGEGKILYRCASGTRYCVQDTYRKNYDPYLWQLATFPISLAATSNLSKTTFIPGESMNNYINARVYARVCSNANHHATARYHLRNLKTGERVYLGQTENYTPGIAHGSGVNYLNLDKWFAPDFPINAPAIGSYSLETNVSLSTNYSAGQVGDIALNQGKTLRATFYHPFTVTVQTPLAVNSCIAEALPVGGPTAGQIGFRADGSIVPARVRYTMTASGGKQPYDYWWNETTTSPDATATRTYGQSSIIKEYITPGPKSLVGAVVDSSNPRQNTRYIPENNGWKQCPTVNITSGNAACTGPYLTTNSCISSTTRRTTIGPGGPAQSSCTTYTDTPCSAGERCVGAGVCSSCSSPVGNSCNGNVKVTTTASCSETRTDCGLTGRTCQDGQCVAPTISCSASPSSPQKNTNVTWSIAPSTGSAQFESYKWSTTPSDAGIIRGQTGVTYQTSYGTAGTKTIYATARGSTGQQTPWVQCSTTVRECVGLGCGNGPICPGDPSCPGGGSCVPLGASCGGTNPACCSGLSCISGKCGTGPTCPGSPGCPGPGGGGETSTITTFRMIPDTVPDGGHCTMFYEATADSCSITSTDLSFGTRRLTLDDDGYINSSSDTNIIRRTENYTLNCSATTAEGSTVTASKSARCFIRGGVIEN